MSLSPIIKGIPTAGATQSAAIWGTKDEMGLTGSICETFEVTPKNTAPTEIEDGAGFTAMEVILAGEWNAEVSFVYDSKKTYPKAGDTVGLVIPNGGQTSGTDTVYPCLLVADPTTSKGRKKETIIKFSLHCRPGLGLSLT